MPGSNVTTKVADESIERFKKTTLSGHHYSCFNGIFILSSPALIPGSKPNNAHIMDITPTALYLMGFPVPEDMDGRVLLEVIRPDFQQKNPLRKVKYNLYKETTEVKMDEKEQEEIKK